MDAPALPTAHLPATGVPDRKAFRAAGAFQAIPEDEALRLVGELDLSTVPELRRRLEPELAEGAHIVLDCSDLTFIDSSGAMALIDATRAIGPRGRIIVKSPRPLVRRVVGVLGLDRLGNVEISDVG